MPDSVAWPGLGRAGSGVGSCSDGSGSAVDGIRSRSSSVEPAGRGWTTGRGERLRAGQQGCGRAGQRGYGRKGIMADKRGWPATHGRECCALLFLGTKNTWHKSLNGSSPNFYGHTR